MKRIGLILLMLLFATPAICAEWDVDVPQSDDSIYDYPDVVQANNSALDRLLSEYNTIKLEYSSVTTIVASAGEVTCSNSDGTIRRMRANTSSTNITFSDIDTGSESSSTTYYIFAVCPDSQTTADFVISTSSSAPSGETYYKRIGSFYNDGSSNITRINNDNIYAELGEYESKTVGTTYQALTDGFVLCRGDSGGGGSSLQVSGRTDSASTPTTVVSYVSIVSSGGDVAQISFPVQKGDYYRCVVTDAGSSVMYWIPLN